MSTKALLSQLAQCIAAESIRVVDLTQVLSPETPVINMPAPLANSPGFRSEMISRFDDAGPAWYWNWFSLGEHTGTHFDAPAHWITARSMSGVSTDALPVQRCIGPACVIDCSREAAANPDFLLEVKHLQAWEDRCSRIPDRSWVLMRTDWSRRASPEEFLNDSHVPGPSVAAMRWLSEKRDVLGWGVETVGTDAGQAGSFDPPFPAHHFMHGTGKFGLASLTNLHQLPATGAIVIAAPLRIRNGSGSPLRVIALVSE